MALQPFTVDHLLQLEEPAARVPMHLSPDGRLLALSVRRGRQPKPQGDDWYTAQGVSIEMVGNRLLVVDVTTGEAVEPFADGSTSWGGQWSPGGSRLAAYVQHGGPVCVGVWQAETKTYRLYPRAVTRAGFGFEVPQWLPDGTGVVVKLCPQDQDLRGGPTRDPEKQAEQFVRIYSFTSDAGEAKEREPSAPAWGVYEAGDLGLVNVDTGEVTALVRDWVFRSWRVAPDGHAVALLRMSGYDEARMQLYYDLTVVPTDGRPPRTVARRVPEGYGICFNWSPEGRRIAFAALDDTNPKARRIFVVCADGSEKPVDLTADEDLGLPAEEYYHSPRWSEDGRAVYCTVSGSVWEFAADGTSRRRITPKVPRSLGTWVQPPTSSLLTTLDGRWIICRTLEERSKDCGLARVDLETGEAECTYEFPGAWVGGAFGVETAPDGQSVYLIAEAADRPAEIRRVSLDDPEPRTLFALNPKLKDVALGRSRVIEYRALEKRPGVGTVRRAAVMLPPDYADGQNLPVIVGLYPGAASSSLVHRFGFEGADVTNAHLYTSRGYAVMWPDVLLGDRDPMRWLAGEVIPAVNKLAELGIADPERVGVMGHSYGGYGVLALLTQTDRFKAAVATAGMVNLLSYGTIDEDTGESDVGLWESGQLGCGGSLWEKRDAYIENSPLFYLDRVTTPLLLVAGTYDPEESAQAKQAYGALKWLGKTVELRLYLGEGHWPGFWTERSLRDLSERVLAWFDEHLKGVG